jgi:hypothetical protein
MHLSHLGTSLEIWSGRNQAVAFTAVNEQQFPLSRYYRIGDLSSVSLVVTRVELMPKWHKCINVFGDYVEK